MGTHDNAAQDGRVDVLAQHDLLAQILGKLLGDNRAQLVIKRDDRSHVDDANAELFLGSLVRMQRQPVKARRDCYAPP